MSFQDHQVSLPRVKKKGCAFLLVLENDLKSRCMSSEETTTVADRLDEDVAQPATSQMVKDYVMTRLDAREANTQHTNTDVLTVFIIILFSFLFLYLQKAIYFTK